jgi:beta-arabinofuranosyltransferase
MQQHAISTSRNENHNYGYPDQYQQTAGLPTEVTEPLHPPVPQSSNDHMPFPMTGQQRDTNHSLGTVYFFPCSYVTSGCVYG